MYKEEAVSLFSPEIRGWWQVRFENNYRTLVAYKNKAADPLTGIADSIVTVNWNSSPVNYPENLITGVSFKNGGFVAHGTVLPKSAGYGDYAAFNTQHWIFRNTNLKEGNQFGWKDDIVGYEVDGALYQWIDGIPAATGTDNSPANFQILGISPGANLDGTLRGHGTMGIYFAGKSFVFNASTTDWVDGLESDKIVQQITRNVINKFLSNKYPPDIVSWSPFRILDTRINNDPVKLNNRIILIPPKDSAVFSIHAIDYFNNTIRYSWRRNGEIVSSDSQYTFATHKMPEENVLTAYAHNQYDSSFISWKIFNSELKIVSSPSKIKIDFGIRFTYQINAISYYDDSLIFSLEEAPGWLSLNTKNELTGIASEPGIGNVKIKVRDQHGNIDEQSFTIEVTANLELYQNFPNPFNTGTVISFLLPQKANVKLRIYDILGEEIVLLMNEELNSGLHKYNPTTTLMTIVIYFSFFFFYVRDRPYGYLFEYTLPMILLHRYHKISQVKQSQARL